jgi:branched-chain amino acid transport system permease protein
VTLIYGILRFSNFAHGDTMAFGAMVTILVTWGLQSAGITLGPLPTALLALPVGIAATGLLVLGTDRVVYKFYRDAEGQADHLRHRLNRGDVHHERHRALHHRRG